MMPYDELEDLALKLAYGTNALCGIETAMRGGPDRPECYLDGLWYICHELNGYARRIKAIIERE